MIWIRIFTFVAIASFFTSGIRVALDIPFEKGKMFQRALYGAISDLCRFLALLSILVAIGAI